VGVDLELLRQHGWDKYITRHLRYGGKVLGICSGYQMLGPTIHDPTGIEVTMGSSQCLGYLPINTTLQIEKQLTHSQGELMIQADEHNNDIDATVSGYQMHVEHTEREDELNAFALLNDAQLDNAQSNDLQLNGCVSADKQVAGGYVHGMFDSTEALQQIIAWVGINVDETETYASQQEHELDRLDDACMPHVDWQKTHTLLTNQINKEQTI
jgi:adenosylcobyric acid synthase